jgi:putative intracellular protease/amidase
VLIGQGAVEPGRWLPPLRSPMIDVSKTRPMAAVLIAVAVAASLLVGGMWALSGKRENSNGAGDAYVHVGKDSSAAIVGDAVDFANAAHTPHTPNTSGAGKAEAAAQGRNVAMGGRKPGVRAWPYELPENISGRRLVLFVLPKRDLWMPDYGPLRGQLERSKRVKVVTASTEPGPCAVHERSPSPETPVEAITALTPELLSQRDFSAVIFLGYDTAPYISGSHAQAAKEVIAGMASQGKLVGSICLGQTVLAHHQVLLGREAAFGEYLQGRVSESQARWRADQQVVIDRSGAFPVITAATDRDAVALANAILEVLDES